MLGVRVPHQIIPGAIPVLPASTGCVRLCVDVCAVMATVFDDAERREHAILAMFTRIYCR
jgi:hypothetical protein